MSQKKTRYDNEDKSQNVNMTKKINQLKERKNRRVHLLMRKDLHSGVMYINTYRRIYVSISYI